MAHGVFLKHWHMLLKNRNLALQKPTRKKKKRQQLLFSCKAKTREVEFRICKLEKLTAKGVFLDRSIIFHIAIAFRIEHSMKQPILVMNIKPYALKKYFPAE